jgi:DNA-binding transcriptional LysR family regulator
LAAQPLHFTVDEKYGAGVRRDRRDEELIGSQALARLEAPWGVRLLERFTQASGLTLEGGTVRRGRWNPRSLRGSRGVVGAFPVSRRGTLRVTGLPSFARHQLASRPPYLLAQHPEFRLKFLLTNERLEFDRRSYRRFDRDRFARGLVFR